MSVTVTAAGNVYLADAVERWDLIRFSPSLELESVTHQASYKMNNGDIVEIPLPTSTCSMVMIFVSQGDAEVATNKFVIRLNKMLMLMGSEFTSIQLTAYCDNTVVNVVIGG